MLLILYYEKSASQLRECFKSQFLARKCRCSPVNLSQKGKGRSTVKQYRIRYLIAFITDTDEMQVTLHGCLHFGIAACLTGISAYDDTQLGKDCALQAIRFSDYNSGVSTSYAGNAKLKDKYTNEQT